MRTARREMVAASKNGPAALELPAYPWGRPEWWSVRAEGLSMVNAIIPSTQFMNVSLSLRYFTRYKQLP